MPEEIRNYQYLLQDRLKKLDMFLEDFENMQDDLRRFNMIARREIMMTQKLLFDFSRSYSKNTQEDLK